MKHTAGKCKCFACENGAEALVKKEAELIQKNGLYRHFVQDDEKCPYGVNAHTHNLKEAYNHKDLQICMNIQPEILNGLFTRIVDEIKKGKKFESGVEYDNIFSGGFKAKFIDAFENGRQVLRLLIPDPNGKYEGKYAEQLTKLNNEKFNPINN